MAERLKVEIVTPSRRVLAQEGDEIVLPASKGEAGILPEHAPLVSMLSPGVVRLRDGKVETKLAVKGGFFQVEANRVMLLADDARVPTEVDRMLVEKELEALESKLIDPNVGIGERESLFIPIAWARARLQII